MMKICLRPDVCNYDLERLKVFCRDAGISWLWYFPAIPDSCGPDVLTDSGRLKNFKDNLAKDGLDLAVISEVITPNVLHADYGELEKVQRSISAAAKASIGTVFIILHFFEVGVAPENAWKNLVEFYKRVIDTAEKTKTKVAVHGLWQPKHIIYNSQSYERLLSAVPSEYNGITLCMGCLHLAGDNVAQVVKRFGRKIFFVHVRDVVGRGDNFKEVFPGDGDVNVYEAISALKDIGYDGLLCPEHFPKIGDEPYMGERSTALCLGYIKGLLAALGK